MAYGSDVNKVRDALIAAAREHSSTLEDPEPTAFLENLELARSISSSSPGAEAEAQAGPRLFRSELNYLIYKHLTAAGIEIPNPQRDLHIRSGVLKVENVTETEMAKRRESADVSSGWRSVD